TNLPSSSGGWSDDGTTVRLSTSTDNVGIGTTVPKAALHVGATDGTISYAGSGDAYIRNDLEVDGSIYATNISNDGAISFETLRANRMTITSAGNIGVGTTTPASSLTVSGGATVGSSYNGTNLPDGYMAVKNGLGVGTSSLVATLDVIG